MTDQYQDSYLPQVVRVDPDKCVNCHMCISECPVKFCNEGCGDYVSVNPDRCIGCGRCITACSHGARIYCDDFQPFMNDLAQGEKVIAIVAPSVAANFPDQFNNLNGWLQSIGVAAIFDVGFGAALSARSYAELLKDSTGETIIAQPCPAIVSYIEIYQPALIKYLAPVDSPMLHLMKMIRKFHPEYSHHRIAAISPCLAKKREFHETGLGDYNVMFLSIHEYFNRHNIDLRDYPEVAYLSPPPGRAVQFPTPGGLMKTVERWIPNVSENTRKIEGDHAVYTYLSSLNQALLDHSEGLPLLVDCLNCSMGCNSGPGALTHGESPDAVEHRISKRMKALQEGAQNKPATDQDSLKNTIERYWDKTLYQRHYQDLSPLLDLNIPSAEEQTDILHRMHKYSDQDLYNCSACGYNRCELMCLAIHNGLNRVENCHHYLMAERLKDEEIIEQNEQRLQSILNTSLEGFVQIDLQGRITDLNLEAQKIMGRPREQLLDQLLNDLLPERASTILKKQLTLRAKGETSRYELTLEHSDGTVVNCLCHGTPLYDQQDNRIGSFGMITDITSFCQAQRLLAEHQNHLERMVEERTLSLKNEIENRKEAETALRGSDRQLRDIFDRTPLAIIVVDCETRTILEANSVALKTIGGSRETLIGENCCIICTADESSCPVLDGGQQVVNAERMLRRIGQEPLQVLKTVVHIQFDGRDCLMESIVDISEQKRVQTALEEAKQAAENNNRSKSEFIANMSHEIRTPMNALTGLTYLALKTDLTATQKNYLTKIRSSSESLLGILNDILDFSKIEAGKIEPEAVQFNLPGMTSQLLDMFGHETQKKGLTLCFDVPSDIPATLVGDSLRLRQVLTNLISNAIKFTKTGQIILHVRTVKCDSDEIALEFAVQDTGIGISPRKMDSVFSAFNQADASTTRKFGGTGLGLSISQGLVELMGGKIRLTSEPGKGSTFAFTLRLGRTEEAPISEMIVQPELSGMRILILDKEECIGQLECSLQQLSCRTYAATSATQALARIKQAPVNDPYQLIIMEWTAIHADKDALFEMIRSQQSRKVAPRIMIISGSWDQALSDTIETEYIDVFLPRPLDFISLQNTIAAQLSTRELNQKSAASETTPNLADKRILIAEDNEINQEIILELLGHTGCSMQIAENGEAAIQCLSTEDYDLVLMDIQMPVMDGYEATRRIRKTESNNGTKRIPIIAMTANAMSEDRKRSLDAGMDAHVAKPVNPDELFSMLYKWTRNQPPPHSKSRILLVDNSEINQLIITEILESSGMEVAIACYGQEGIDTLENGNFDVVLMDLQISVMDGYEAVRRLRGMDRFKTLPILALTADPADDDQIKLKNAGMNGHVKKPVDPVELLSSIRKWTNPRR